MNARKQLRKKDPRRYCRFHKFVHLHEVDGPVLGLLDEMDEGRAKYLGYCRHCDARIEAFLPDQRNWVPKWSDLEWRGEQYIIEELPV